MASFVVVLLLSLAFILCSCFAEAPSSGIDMWLRLCGSAMMFFLGVAFDDWLKERKENRNKKD